MVKGAKQAVQKRSKLTRDKILNAMDELLQVESFESINIAKLSAKAGVSGASIYQRFENKHVLISILIELYMDKVRNWGEEGHNQPDIDNAETLEQCLMNIGVAAWRQFDALGYVMRPAYLYSRMWPELLGETWQAQERAALQGFEAMLKQWPEQVSATNLMGVASMIAYFYNMMFLGRLLHGNAGSELNISHDEREFAQQLTNFVMGYLMTSGAADGND